MDQRRPSQKEKVLEHILVVDTISSYMDSLESSFHIVQCRKRSQGKSGLGGREQPRSWVLWGKICAGRRTLAKLNPGSPAVERLGERFNQCLKRQVKFSWSTWPERTNLLSYRDPGSQETIHIQPLQWFSPAGTSLKAQLKNGTGEGEL